MDLGPQRVDVIDMAEKREARSLLPFDDCLVRDRGGIGGVGFAGDQHVDPPAATCPQRVRRDQHRQALVGQQAADKADGDWRRRLGHRSQCIGVDPGAGYLRDFVAAHPKRLQGCAVVRILHQDRSKLSIEQPFEHSTETIANNTRLRRLRGEGKAQSGERIQAHDRQSERGQRSDKGWDQGDMVGEGGPDAPVKAADFENGGQQMQRVEAATPPADTMQDKSFPFDGFRMRGHPGRDMDLEPGTLGRPRHRQTMGDEIPVLGYENADAARAAVDGFHCHGIGGAVGSFCQNACIGKNT